MSRRTDIPGAVPTWLKILLGVVVWLIIGIAVAWLAGRLAWWLA